MKPQALVRLSDEMAARLALAAARPGMDRSALVEEALGRYLNADGLADQPPLNRCIEAISRQLEQLSKELRVVRETVALQARFQLAIAPVLAGSDVHTACQLGSERFDEFASQVTRRVELGSSLIEETIERIHREAKEEADAAAAQAVREARPEPQDVEKHTYAPSSVDAVYPGDYTGLPQ